MTDDTLVNGLKAIFGTSQSATTIASTNLMPFMASNGDPVGLTGMANLASVLGEVGVRTKIENINTLTSVDDLVGDVGYKKEVFCILNSEPSGLPDGFLASTRFFITVANVGNYYIYQYIYDRNGDIYTRYSYNSTWSSFKKL